MWLHRLTILDRYAIMYKQAVDSGAFTVSNTGTKRIDIIKLLQIPIAVEILKEHLKTS